MQRIYQNLNLRSVNGGSTDGLISDVGCVDMISRLTVGLSTVWDTSNGHRLFPKKYVDLDGVE